MAQVQSISPQEAFTRTSDGLALLVCAYDNDDKFRRVHLEGAVPLSAFKANLLKTPQDRELIFY